MSSRIAMSLSAMAGGLATIGVLSLTDRPSLRSPSRSPLSYDLTASPYIPSQPLQDRISNLPLYQHIRNKEGFRRAPYHPLLIDAGMAASVGSDSAASNAPLADSSVEDDEHHQHIKRILQPDVEGTLMRGKLLFREGGIEHGSGWVSKDRRTMVMFVHLGDLICGHKGLVHGGLISAIFDDCMGYLFFADAASKYTGFTASLKVDYRHIMPANRTIAVCVRIKEHQGRKVYLTAEACDAECMFVPVVPTTTTTNSSSGGGASRKLIPASEFADLVGAKSTLYAQAEALFVIPKPSWTTAPVSYLFSTIRSTFGI